MEGRREKWWEVGRGRKERGRRRRPESKEERKKREKSSRGM